MKYCNNIFDELVLLMTRVESIKAYYHSVEHKVLSFMDKCDTGGKIAQVCGAAAKGMAKVANYTSKSKELGIFFDSIKYFKSFDLFRSVPTLYKSVKKCYYQDKKLWPALKAINSGLCIGTSIADIVSLLAKVSSAVTKTFAALGLICSVLDFTIDRNKLKKTSLRLKNFTDSVGYNKQGRYNIHNYEQLYEYINKTGTEALAKQFKVDAERLKKALPLKLREINPVNGEFQEKKLKKIMELFHNRLEYKRQDCKVALIVDCFNILGTALMVASVVQPWLLALWAVTNGAVSAIRFVADKVNQYKFENQMGMIHRGTESHAHGAKDFMKWLFHLYPAQKPVAKA